MCHVRVAYRVQPERGIMPTVASESKNATHHYLVRLAIVITAIIVAVAVWWITVFDTPLVPKDRTDVAQCHHQPA